MHQQPPTPTERQTTPDLTERMNDISARKRAEAQAQAAEARQRRLLEHLPTAVSVAALTPDRRILFSNAQFERTFGYSPQDIPTLADWARRAYPDAAYRARAAEWWDGAVARAAAGNGQIEAREFRVTRKDGAERTVRISASVVDDLLITAFDDVTERTRAAAELAAKEAELRRLIDGLPMAVAIITLDASPRILFLNQQMVQTFGYTLADIPTVEQWAHQAYPDAGYRREVFEIWDAAVARAVHETGQVESMELRVTCKDGRVRDTLINAIVLADRLLIGLMDISERRQAERDLRSTREALERTAYELTEAIPVGTYTMVLRPGAEMAQFAFMSRRFLELTGLEREEAQRDTMKAFAGVHPEDFDDWVRLNAEAFAAKRRFFGQTRVIVKGEVRWVTAESIPRDLPDGTTVWEGVLIDVTERVRAEQALKQANLDLKRLATTDRLTGAHNRWSFEDVILAEIARLHRYAEPMSLLLFDVDHFKVINDTHGHQAGDTVLVELSQRVRAQLRAVDALARWGGEEFAVLLPQCTLAQAEPVAEKLRRLIASQPFAQVGRVTASFGVAGFLPQDTLDTVLKRADDALYAAKSAGRNRVCVATD
ncbi:sensor domain-containing diguanylate cyclase [Thiocapsa sp. UBA6158]|jgi:diguanylate cyclase (GGDEF)-like protein/PAS domain S-box-containing protein|uniref:sensor domain-containing diguanylate cyclase n=1 Tax=Thiocapsa sp. UBA6158 TaxID=1947692 RepID=UPI0025D2BF71|nr:diguanylate cyclase [Thiocapsa sp. UBA6158]